MRQAGLFGLSDHLKRLSAVGDPLETMERVVDFEVNAGGQGAGLHPMGPVRLSKGVSHAASG